MSGDLLRWPVVTVSLAFVTAGAARVAVWHVTEVDET